MFRRQFESNQALVGYLQKVGHLETDRLVEAFQTVDRADFVRPGDRAAPYGNYPLSIGSGQTISQPSTVAFMFEQLQPEAGDKVLDLGCGSGWTTALLAQVVGEDGQVWGVEIVPELVEFGQNNLAKYNFDQAEISQTEPDQLGLPKKSPFDKILVSAAGKEVPESLLQQLNNPGRMVIPVKSSIVVVEKGEDGQIEQDYISGFRFVPLKH